MGGKVGRKKKKNGKGRGVGRVTDLSQGPNCPPITYHHHSLRHQVGLLQGVLALSARLPNLFHVSIHRINSTPTQDTQSHTLDSKLLKFIILF